MQLYEQGKVQFDDPVQKYLPDFNTANDPVRAEVTVRMLLTHTSGETGDVELKDPWGLAADRQSRRLSSCAHDAVGVDARRGFRYSDINFILLGLMVEKLTGEAEDDYVQQNVFAPLGMTETRYLPAAKACGPHSMRGAALAWAPSRKGARRSGARQARGAPACCRGSRRRHATKKAERIRARIPISITCSGAR